MPPADEQKDSIIITGPRSNVDSAKSTILAKVDEYLKEEEDKKLKSFQVKIN